MRSNLQKELNRIVSAAVSQNPQEWAGYCLRPLQVASSLRSPFLQQLADAVSLNLDYEIDTQQKDGAWHPTWSWGDSYPDSWEVAKREWRGVLTLDKLKTLKLFDRIERWL